MDINRGRTQIRIFHTKQNTHVLDCLQLITISL